MTDERRRMGQTGKRVGWSLFLGGGAALMFAFLALPLAALLLTASPRELLEGLQAELVGPALLLSLGTTVCSVAIVIALGTPLAWWLARSRGRLARAAEVVAQLPIVVPPAVGGLALLLTFGRRGLLGAPLEVLGLQLSFTTAAVVLAEVFVCAPFYIQSAAAAFRALDPGYLHVARTLGASPGRVFFRVALPLAAPGLVSGAALAWARALGEFGATLMFAGNMTGRTQTLPLAIYTALEVDVREAQAIAVLLVGAAVALLAVVRGAQAWAQRSSEPA